MFLPVKLQNSSKEIVGEMKSYAKLTYQKNDYNFEFVPRPVTKLFNNPNVFKVLRNQNKEIAMITDPQWLREIRIEIPHNGTFSMVPKISLRENYDIKLNGVKIGEFREQYLAFSPKGYLDINESQSKNSPLIISIIFMGLHNRMVSS